MGNQDSVAPSFDHHLGGRVIMQLMLLLWFPGGIITPRHSWVYFLLMQLLCLCRIYYMLYPQVLKSLFNGKYYRSVSITNTTFPGVQENKLQEKQMRKIQFWLQYELLCVWGGGIVQAYSLILHHNQLKNNNLHHSLSKCLFKSLLPFRTFPLQRVFQTMLRGRSVL